MNERLTAVLNMAQVRDAIVDRIFFTATAVMLSAYLLHLADFPMRLRKWLLGAQLTIVLAAWIILLVVLAYRS